MFATDSIFELLYSYFEIVYSIMQTSMGDQSKLPIGFVNCQHIMSSVFKGDKSSEHDCHSF